MTNLIWIRHRVVWTRIVFWKEQNMNLYTVVGFVSILRIKLSKGWLFIELILTKKKQFTVVFIADQMFLLWKELFLFLSLLSIKVLNVGYWELNKRKTRNLSREKHWEIKMIRQGLASINKGFFCYVQNLCIELWISDRKGYRKWWWSFFWYCCWLVLMIKMIDQSSLNHIIKNVPRFRRDMWKLLTIPFKENFKDIVGMPAFKSILYKADLSIVKYWLCIIT